MTSWIGQYCINVTDLERSVAFYEALGLSCTSRTEIDQAFEAIVEHATAYGSKLQLAQQKAGPFVKGNALWKLYVNVQDIESTWAKALELGATAQEPPLQLDRWPVTIAFFEDPDGHLVELVQRDPWPDEAPKDAPWLGQYCINVSDLDASIAFWETLGLTCTSRTEIPQAFEAILQNPDTGGSVQLAQQKDAAPIEMGAVWKLYVHTDDVEQTHKAAVAAGYTETLAPLRPERWPVTISFVQAPDGYSVELVQRHND